MYYGWRRRSEIRGPRYWTALIAPLIAVAVILLGVTWEVSRADADGAELYVPPPAAQLAPDPATIPGLDDAPGAQLGASPNEAASLRQQLSDANVKLRQGDAALIATNQRVQTLEGEVAAAAQKLAEAEAKRQEALRVAGKMWEDWRRLRQDLDTACAALDGSKHAAQNQDSAALDACRDAKQQ